MKRVIVLVSTILACTCSFAETAGLSNGSPQLKTLSSAWKNQQRNNLQLSKDDITMGYGGADLSRQPVLKAPSTTA